MSTTSSQTENERQRILIKGKPNPKQQAFFNSRARFTAYGGARGGGKSWALRRKLVAMCLRYEGLKCLLVRRTLPELKANHVLPFLKEYGELITYSESERALKFSSGSRIFLGFCATDKDALRYQGQEYDVIAIDEATQISEYRFSIFKACLRGTSDFPRRMYLTCNPGGIGHAWVKRLFVDRDFRQNEDPDDYAFIQALVFDNTVLTHADPDYVSSLQTLPERMKDAWLWGKWDVFEGQFFPEFDTERHVCDERDVPELTRRFVAFDYGFDMLAALLVAVDTDGGVWVLDESCVPNLTLTEAAETVSALCRDQNVEFAVASPDLWNRRQDSGKSGYEIMQAVYGMPPMLAADDRRIAGWRMVREYLSCRTSPSLHVTRRCEELIRCLPALLFDSEKTEDASGEPHSVTHAPEALRYALMSRCQPPVKSLSDDFIIPKKRTGIFY